MKQVVKDIYSKTRDLLGIDKLTLELKLTKKWNYKKSDWFDGVRYCFEFENNYIVSVIKNFGSYGAKDDKWEVAILKNGELIKTDLIEDNIVQGWMSDEDVEEFLSKVEILSKTGGHGQCK